METLFAVANKSGLQHISLDGHVGFCGKPGYFPAAKVSEDEWRESGWCCHRCVMWLNAGYPRPDIPTPNSGPLGEGCRHLTSDYEYQHACANCRKGGQSRFNRARVDWEYLVRLNDVRHGPTGQVMLGPMVIVHLADCHILDDVYAFDRWIATDQKPNITECRFCFGYV